jgi:glyoxylase-like metal-dependent hydrolase (beta-lactamase superfamily II)
MSKIHILNCAELQPYFPPIKGAGTYCLLVETNHGLVLVDTAMGLKDFSEPTPLMNWFLHSLRIKRDPETTAIRQIEKLGFTPKEVNHIVLTHMHLDHAGGLADFPWAKVHVHRREHYAAIHRQGRLAFGYLHTHWQHNPDWVLHDSTGDKWFGFDAFQIIEGIIPEIWMIPLPGHTQGHCGVAIQREGRWLLQAGDCSYPIRSGDRPKYLASLLSTPIVGKNIPHIYNLIQENSEQIEMVTSHFI